MNLRFEEYFMCKPAESAFTYNSVVQGVLNSWENVNIHLTLYLMEAPFNTSVNIADPDPAALLRAARSGSTLFALGNIIRYDPTLVDLTSNFFILCKCETLFILNSQWVELSMNIHEGKG